MHCKGLVLFVRCSNAFPNYNRQEDDDDDEEEQDRETIRGCLVRVLRFLYNGA